MFADVCPLSSGEVEYYALIRGALGVQSHYPQEVLQEDEELEEV